MPLNAVIHLNVKHAALLPKLKFCGKQCRKWLHSTFCHKDWKARDKSKTCIPANEMCHLGSVFAAAFAKWCVSQHKIHFQQIAETFQQFAESAFSSSCESTHFAHKIVWQEFWQFTESALCHVFHWCTHKNCTLWMLLSANKFFVGMHGNLDDFHKFSFGSSLLFLHVLSVFSSCICHSLSLMNKAF